MIAVVAKGGLLRRLPTSGRIDYDDWLAGVVVDAQIFGDDAMDRPPPTVDGLTAALDDVAEYLVTVEVEVRLDGHRSDAAGQFSEVLHQVAPHFRR